MREERVAEVVGGGGTALCATGVEEEAPAVDAFITLDMAYELVGVNDVGELERDLRALDRETRVDEVDTPTLPRPAPPPPSVSLFLLRLNLWRVSGNRDVRGLRGFDLVEPHHVFLVVETIRPAWGTTQ